MLEPVVMSTRPIEPVRERITIITPQVERTERNHRIWRAYIHRAGESMACTQAAFPFLAGLMIARGQMVRRDDVCDALYGDREDGGPLWMESTLNVILSRHRLDLKRLNIRVDVRYGIGWSAHDVAEPSYKSFARRMRASPYPLDFDWTLT